ncbi:hypothetical protein ACWF8M_10630, partial [Streptomyces sp. NPDC055008]
MPVTGDPTRSVGSLLTRPRDGCPGAVALPGLGRRRSSPQASEGADPARVRPFRVPAHPRVIPQLASRVPRTRRHPASRSRTAALRADRA